MDLMEHYAPLLWSELFYNLARHLCHAHYRKIFDSNSEAMKSALDAWLFLLKKVPHLAFITGPYCKSVY